MSGNAAARTSEGTDRRRARTRQALVQAFVSLVFERRYDDVDVPGIVERANIGRSTFYEHFNSKDALLRASMEGLLGVLAGAATDATDNDRLRRVIAHFWENRRLGRTVFAPPLRALVERQLADLVEQRLGEGRRLAATQVAAAQISALEAWLGGSVVATAEQMADAIIVTRRIAAC